MRFSERAKTGKQFYSAISKSLALSLKGTAGMTMWLLRPASRSMIHFVDEDRQMSPWGAVWRQHEGKRHCSHCRSIHPIDFLDSVKGLVRWKPGEAHSEMKGLIERGEVEDSLENRLRWQTIGQGAMICDINFPEASTATLRAHTWRHEDFYVHLTHLGELHDDDYARFRKWAAEMLPELSLGDREGCAFDLKYDPMADPMTKIPIPPLMGIVIEPPTDED